MEQFARFDLGTMKLVEIKEYLAIETAEERLMWLYERTPFLPPLDPSTCTDKSRVHGCQSGLWLTAERTGGTFTFRARSDSKMVEGVASFLCDLYSGRTAVEIASMNHFFVALLGLEALLSITRKRAVASVYMFIQNTACIDQAAAHDCDAGPSL